MFTDGKKMFLLLLLFGHFSVSFSTQTCLEGFFPFDILWFSVARNAATVSVHSHVCTFKQYNRCI